MAGGQSAELETIMSKPETLYEKASQELNQFRERRLAERRAVARDTPDRRKQPGSVPQTEPDQKDDEQQQTG